MAATRLSLFLLLFAPLAFFAAFFLAPMGVVLISSLTSAQETVTFANYARILFDQYHWDVLWRTARISLLTTVICMIVGYPLAYFLVHGVSSRTLRRTFIVLLVLPLFTSNIVRSFGWMVLLGRRGLVNESLTGLGLIDSPFRFLGTEAGVIIGLVYINMPFIVIAVGNALAKIDRSYTDASSDLGASRFTSFWTITFPLSLPGLTAGALLVFALSVGAYVTPAVLGGGQVTMFSMLIFQQYTSVFDFNYGGALSITLLLLTLAMVSLSGIVGKPRGGR
ncbi:MAG: ABC transporter permease [Aquamicrobium sp.]|uniref:ABC transporter permease n=1 Tax=Aquamicrobium sp. TaxID=1872579 RepID=UPI00349E5C18|nr:ABC transporter permease [Aquamicrobium sp.]